MLTKFCSIYFVILAIPATLAGLYGVWAGVDFSLTPDEPGDPDELNYPFLYTVTLGLAVFLIGGWFFVPGYVRQAFRRETGSKDFWKKCAIYNAALLAGVLAFLFPLGRPLPTIDWFLIELVASFAGLPCLGFLLSFLCYRSLSHAPTNQNLRPDESR